MMGHASIELDVDLSAGVEPEPDVELDAQPRPRVLIADDSEIVREALGQLLLHSGYEVEAVADGAAAIRALKEAKIDALLLDLQMPEHDGFEALGYVQEHRRGLPVILLSGLPADEIQGRMQKLASGELPPLFQKPCDYDQLLVMLDLMLSGELPTQVD